MAKVITFSCFVPRASIYSRYREILLTPSDVGLASARRLRSKHQHVFAALTYSGYASTSSSNYSKESNCTRRFLDGTGNNIENKNGFWTNRPCIFSREHQTSNLKETTSFAISVCDLWDQKVDSECRSYIYTNLMFWSRSCFHLNRVSPLLYRNRRVCSPALLDKSGVINKEQLVANYQLQRRTFVSRYITEISPKVLPYLNLIRFDKPIGTWLLFLPCTWSIALAASPGMLPDVKMLALFGAGSFFMRGSGCIVNDLWDSDFDRKVWRTKDRPLASGNLTQFQALVFLGGLLSLSLSILLSLNWYSVFLGAFSMSLVITYPLMKRVTFWPQAFLGLTFNWGALLGYAAVQGCCNWSIVLPLYFSGIFWTLVYDTIYAHQDKADDILIGVKSTALLFGDKTPQYLYTFSTAMVTCLLMTGYNADQTFIYFCGVGAVASHLLWQIRTVNLNSHADCLDKFKSNKWLGLILFTTIVIGNLLKEDQNGKQEKGKTQDKK